MRLLIRRDVVLGCIIGIQAIIFLFCLFAGYLLVGLNLVLLLLIEDIGVDIVGEVVKVFRFLVVHLPKTFSISDQKCCFSFSLQPRSVEVSEDLMFFHFSC